MAQATEKTKKDIPYFFFRLIRGAVHLLYPKTRFFGTENLPEEGCIVVSNHAQMHGPLIGELYFPGERAIWCISNMMELKEVPAYAYKDFWSEKPKPLRPFFKLLSYIIAPLAACVFPRANTIPVYHDSRLLSTFRLTLSALEEGKRIIIFPECKEKNTHIVNQFQEKFVDTAKMYYARTGKKISFVPMYLAPRRREAHIAPPIEYCPENDMKTERERICRLTAEAITSLAETLPKHKVVPYDNISPKYYSYNNEKTR